MSVTVQKLDIQMIRVRIEVGSLHIRGELELHTNAGGFRRHRRDAAAYLVREPVELSAPPRRPAQLPPMLLASTTWASPAISQAVGCQLVSKLPFWY